MPKVGMPEIRKPQLVKATMSVIDRVGLHAASISLISKEAGVSTGIINHYFGGKHGLLEETMREILRQLSATIKENLSQLMRIINVLMPSSTATLWVSKPRTKWQKLGWHSGRTPCMTPSSNVCNE